MKLKAASLLLLRKVDAWEATSRKPVIMRISHTAWYEGMRVIILASEKGTTAVKSTQVNEEKAHRHSSKLLVHGEQGLICYRAALTCFCSDRVVFLRLYGLHSCRQISPSRRESLTPQESSAHEAEMPENSGACSTRQGHEMMACRCIIHFRTDAVSCLQP